MNNGADIRCEELKTSIALALAVAVPACDTSLPPRQAPDQASRQAAKAKVPHPQCEPAFF
jgi:hypothetical protein